MCCKAAKVSSTLETHRAASPDTFLLECISSTWVPLSANLLMCVQSSHMMCCCWLVNFCSGPQETMVNATTAADGYTFEFSAIGSGSTAHLLQLDSQVPCPQSYHLQNAAEAKHGACWRCLKCGHTFEATAHHQELSDVCTGKQHKCLYLLLLNITTF